LININTFVDGPEHYPCSELGDKDIDTEEDWISTMHKPIQKDIVCQLLVIAGVLKEGRV